VSFLKIGAGKAVLCVWACMKLHLLVYRGTVRHSDIKERLGEVCVLRHRVRNLQCLFVCVYIYIYGKHHDVLELY
jgi:hypothetical protein